MIVADQPTQRLAHAPAVIAPPVGEKTKPPLALSLDALFSAVDTILHANDDEGQPVGLFPLRFHLRRLFDVLPKKYARDPSYFLLAEMLEDMEVCAYCKKPVDWEDLGNAWRVWMAGDAPSFTVHEICHKVEQYRAELMAEAERAACPRPPAKKQARPQKHGTNTSYAGYLFRSRVEARWAVCLDQLGCTWDYEAEDFQLEGIGRYLPDFWISSLGMWAEVKGILPTKRERAKCEALIRLTGKPCLLLVGVPDLKTYEVLRLVGDDVTSDETGWQTSAQAVEAARSARFEFGETPEAPR